MPPTFREIWCIDFEFVAPPGELPRPICMVGHEILSEREIRLWENEFGAEAPFSLSPDILIVAHYASAEIGCFLQLGWPDPNRLVDTFCEFRCLTNTTETSLPSAGLVNAMLHFGLDTMGADAKDANRNLIVSGGPWTADERERILHYCASDVLGTVKLFQKLQPNLDWPRALLRGRYMIAVAKMEREGVPIDAAMLKELIDNWKQIQEALIKEINGYFQVYEDTTFKEDKFAVYLERERIPWPRLGSGCLQLDDDSFDSMSQLYPQLKSLKELRVTLGQMRLNSLSVGKDGRNRCLLSAFRSRTGRNQPSNSKFIFGPAVWLRSLIRPPTGTAMAYIDYSQQEFGIAAALSHDPNMMHSYLSGDPYLAFAILAKAAPESATKTTHESVRNLYKRAILSMQYGAGYRSLSMQLGILPFESREIIAQHKRVYATFWKWLEKQFDLAILRGSITTTFGWRLKIEAGFNGRSIENFPMQANGAEMLRLACCLATERGINVGAPIHDALLISATSSEIDEKVAIARGAMREASRVILRDMELRTDAKIIKSLEHYSDPRGVEMWQKIMRILNLNLLEKCA